MCFGMEMHLFLFLYLGFCIQDGIAQSGNVTVCRNEEEYQECGSCESTCDKRNEICQTPCHPGCFCKSGLLRARDRSCVQPKDCNRPKCKENEEFYECGSQCPLTCKNYQEPIFCTKQCTKGCFCKPGYVTGPTGKCILPKDCPVGACRENELTTDCINPCNNCEQRGKCYYEYCNKGCDCKPGFFKNSTGYCVPPNKCDVQEYTCPKNEHYVSCVSYCNDCWSRGECEEHFCHPGCDCLPGHFRNENEDCVPENQCKAEGGYCGGANEEYSECAISCNDCHNRGKCQYTCEYGCDCKKGYYRDAKGVCILASECPGGRTYKCPAGEEYHLCPPTCKKTCDTYHGQGGTQCQQECRAGCACKEGMVKNQEGACVYPQQCPQECRDNEEYLECGSACPETCLNRGQTVACAAHCVKGCFCKKGFIRGPDGICVYPDKCPLVCGVNEEYLECGSPCPLTCTNFTVSSHCPKVCVQGCVCKPGYVRGPTGACILPRECPVVCQEYEEYLECGSGCQRTCGNTTIASCALPCHKGCFCKPGYTRAPDGKCILPQQCPIVCQEYEEYLECGPGCQGTCGNTTIASCALPCHKGCFCKPGYIRAPDGKCILPQQCPIVCQEYEEYLECGPGCQAACDNTTVASCALPCRKGCFCKPGYIRGPYGKCILPQQCPIVCQEYEEYLECGPGCQGTCDNTTIASCVLPCRKGCFCKSGYIRGPDGKCILPQQCPIVCQENEVFLECGCQGTCDMGMRPDGLCSRGCTKGCFCKPGYVRGPYGRCILPTQCPVGCQENEVFIECGSPCQDTCENIGKTVTGCPLTCIKGCFCKPGYIRGPNGKCILPNQCPLVCQGNEELNSCGSPCQRTCDNIGQAVTPCTLPCIKGCFCKPGYVRGPTNLCILPTECPVVCGEYEEFQKCGTACPVTCFNQTSTNACTLQCVEGCFCKPGFIRGPNGKCIPPTSCPVVCGENEMYDKCGSACPITCSNRSATTACTLACIEGCFCKPGLVRGPDGKCILPTSCPVSICGENEQFFECRSPCQQTCENRNSVINCTYPCLTGCFCKPGFVRDSNGKCIDPNSCPTGPCTMENEIYNPCGPACIKTCGRLEFRQLCPQRCVRGCFCREGFVRDIFSNCIRFENCPKEAQMCPTGESFYACKPTCRNTCDTIDFQGPCDDLCRPGCECRGGLVRDTTTNRCVPLRQCPSSLVGRRSGDDIETTTRLDPIIVTTVSLPISNEDEPPNVTKAKETTIERKETTIERKETTIGITSKVTLADAGTQKPAITTTPSPAPTTLGQVLTQTKLDQPVTTLKPQLTTMKEIEAPTVVPTKPAVTSLNIPTTTTPSPATTNPVTIGKTGQQEISTDSKPIETTPSKPIETTPSKPIETPPPKAIETTPSKPVETTPSKPVVPITSLNPVVPITSINPVVPITSINPVVPITSLNPVVTTINPVATTINPVVTAIKPVVTTFAKTAMTETVTVAAVTKQLL